jgi:DNA-binding LacI/PurR family transcriptional regulator
VPQQRKSSKPTLAAVAFAANLSVPTVSKVLRGGTDVSASTRERVVRIADELGYSRAGGTRTTGQFASQSNRLIDLVISNVEGTWPSRVLSGVEHAASSADCDVVITVARSDRDWVGRLLRRPSEGAIVVLVGATPAQLKALQAGGVPVVLIDPQNRAPKRVASVGVTNWEGGRQAGEHLVGLGHTNIGVIGGTTTLLYSQARVDGFRAALTEKGIPLDPDMVLSADYDYEEARQGALALLQRRERPTAIFAGSDIMALGVYEAAAELGLRIPDDLSVIGFDDVPEATWATPRMTTIRQPIHEMGAAALRMLLRLDQDDTPGPSSGAPREELATELVIRESTSRPR